MTYFYSLTQDLNWQSKAQWQTPDTPFMRFEYWQALTQTGAIGEKSGWTPIYIIVYRAEDLAADELEGLNDAALEPYTPVAVMPVFLKAHHQGEYVFDHAWAEAYARYGMDYYPRLVTSVPYTPVSGQRFWLAKGSDLSSHIVETALQGIDDIAKQTQASSWHGLFVQHELVALTRLEGKHQLIEQSLTENPLVKNPLNENQLLERQGCQFIWHNQNLSNSNHKFTSFDEFLATLTAKKRKNIRAERKKVAKQNISCQLKTGDEITEADWATFYHCYVMTYAVRGRQPYLTQAFFEQLGKTLPQHLMLAQALDEAGEVIASSLFFYDDPADKNATLYGRYWGALAEYDSLHFELCYYQGIEFAIAQGLQYFDPGTQGEHKLIRGFVPSKTHSLHRIYDERFVPAIADFCQQDRDYMAQYRQQAHEALPFNIDNMPKFNG